MDILKAYNSYLRIERAMSQNTVASYCSDVDKFLKFFKAPAERLSAEDVSEYLASTEFPIVNKIASIILSIFLMSTFAPHLHI